MHIPKYSAGVCVCLTLALFAGKVAAQGGIDLSKLPAWTSELQAKRAEAGRAATEVSNAESAMAPKQKEVALWDGELNKMRPLYAGVTSRITTHNAEAARERAAVARHNASCPAKVATQAQAARCNGELPSLRAWKNRVDASKANLDREVAQLDKRRDSMLNRRRQLVAEMQPMLTRYKQAKAKLDAANQRIRTLQSWIVAARSACARVVPGKNDVGEALHYCNSMQWDNAVPGLPPLNNPKPPFSATPNR